MTATHDFRLAVGSRYVVTSLASREAVLRTKGLFRGFAAVGSGDGLVFEVLEGEGKGLLRIVPSHMVVAIDVLDPAPPPTEKKRDEETDRHYL